MAESAASAELKERFEALSKELGEAETQILKELEDAQGGPVDFGGYYRPDHKKAEAAMRPSRTLNAILSGFSDVSLKSL